MNKKTVLQVAGGIFLCAAGVYLFLKNVQIQDLWNEILSIQIWVILFAVILNPLSLWLRSLRWRLILPDNSCKSRKTLFPVVMIGFMINNILPARLGEAARAVLLWKRNGYTFTQSAGSLIVERILDTLVFLSFFFIPVFFRSDLKELLIYALIASGLFCGVLIAFIIYSRYPDLILKKINGMIDLLPEKLHTGCRKIADELISNLEWLFSGRKAFSIGILSGLVVFCQMMVMLLLANGETAFGILGSMFGVAFAALGSVIPLSPGYIGTLHAVLLQGLNLLGMELEKAGAIAILYHAIGYFTVTVIGLYYFFCTRISIKELGKAKEKIKKGMLQEG